jgi:hypothetical protein
MNFGEFLADEVVPETPAQALLQLENGATSGLQAPPDGSADGCLCLA